MVHHFKMAVESQYMKKEVFLLEHSFFSRFWRFAVSVSWIVGFMSALLPMELSIAAQTSP